MVWGLLVRGVVMGDQLTRLRWICNPAKQGVHADGTPTGADRCVQMIHVGHHPWALDVFGKGRKSCVCPRRHPGTCPVGTYGVSLKVVGCNAVIAHRKGGMGHALCIKPGGFLRSEPSRGEVGSADSRHRLRLGNLGCVRRGCEYVDWQCLALRVPYGGFPPVLKLTRINVHMNGWRGGHVFVGIVLVQCFHPCTNGTVHGHALQQAAA